MPLFIYNAVDQNGRTKTGEIQAADKAAALELLERQKLTPIKLVAKGEAGKKKFMSLSVSFFQGSITPVDKILLTKHLSAVVRAGLSMHEALEILWEDARKPILKRFLFDAKTNLERGQPLSVTFEMYPRYFPIVFTGIIKAGEKSGNLENALENLGTQLLRDLDLTRRVRAAMIYPAILMVASIGVVVLLLTFLLPRLLKVFQTTKVALPLITRIFVAMSDVLSARPLITVLIFLILLVATVLTIRSPKGRQFLIAQMQRFPISGDLVKKLALARFTRTFNNLLKSGVGALEAIEITAHTTGNKAYEAALLKTQEELRKGASLSDAFREQQKLFPRLLVSMVAVGERTGTLETTLKTLSEFYDEEADRTLKNLVALLEPLLLLFMGVVVGGVALSVILPIYQLVGGIH